MTESLKALLFNIRQHAAFPELLRAIARPDLPRWKSSEGIGAFNEKAIHASGAQKQHEQWIALLTGNSSKLED